MPAFVDVGFINNGPFVDDIVRGVVVIGECDALGVVDVMTEPNEKCGIVF